MTAGTKPPEDPSSSARRAAPDQFNLSQTADPEQSDLTQAAAADLASRQKAAGAELSGSFSLAIGPELAGQRLDALLARFFPEKTRSNLAKAIKSGLASLDGRPVKPGTLVRAGQTLNFQPPLEPKGEIIPDNSIKLDIIYQDNDILVINKPAGLTVHRGIGHEGETLASALLAHDPGLLGVGEDPERPGLVHRLDKDTSGVMVTARNQETFLFLSQAFADRQVSKRYLAFVRGDIPARGEIDSPISRHPTLRHKMRAGKGGTRAALTRFRVIKRFPEANISLTAVDLVTGRTHQARVHLASIGAPVLADRVYGRGLGGLAKDHPALAPLLTRQFLHARRLSIPGRDGGRLTFLAPWPPDFLALMKELLKLEKSANK